MPALACALPYPSPLGKRFRSFVIPATTCDGGEHATVDGGGSSSDGGSHGSGARDDGPDQLDTGWADGSAADGAEPEPGPEPRLRSEQRWRTDRLDRRRWLGPRSADDAFRLLQLSLEQRTVVRSADLPEGRHLQLQRLDQDAGCRQRERRPSTAGRLPSGRRWPVVHDRSDPGHRGLDALPDPKHRRAPGSAGGAAPRELRRRDGDGVVRRRRHGPAAPAAGRRLYALPELPRHAVRRSAADDEVRRDGHASGR